MHLFVYCILRQLHDSKKHTVLLQLEQWAMRLEEGSRGVFSTTADGFVVASSKMCCNALVAY